MLHITFSRAFKTDRVLLFPASQVFESVFDCNILTEDICKRIVKAIDQSDVVAPNLIQSPVLDAISPSQLSGGCKAVLLAYTEDQMLSSVNLGDNCVEPLLEVAENKDVYVLCTTDLFIPNELFSKYDIFSLDENRLFTDYHDFSRVQYKYDERFEVE